MSKGWTEQDSRTFTQDADCFVPERELLVESVCRLIPAGIESNLVVELCCGDGTLSEAILSSLEGVRVLALDGSEAMLEACARRTERYKDRIVIRWFDLGNADWRRFAEAPRAIVSTFAIHHLTDIAKRRLFRDLAGQLAPGGVLAIADLIRPSSEVATRLAAWQWDQAVKQRSIQFRGDLSGFASFRAERWNHHALEDPDPIDQPGPSAGPAPLALGGGTPKRGCALVKGRNEPVQRYQAASLGSHRYLSLARWADRVRDNVATMSGASSRLLGLGSIELAGSCSSLAMLK